MAGRFTSWTRRIFLFFNFLAVFLFLLACLIPYFSPKYFWFLSLLGLGFPILFLVLIFFIFFWIIFLPRYTLISIIALLLGWKGISVFITLRPIPDFQMEKQPNTIRVVHWNVARFTEWRRNNNKGSQRRLKMMDLIQRQNADVLCFSEFYHSVNPIYYDNLNYIRKKMGYRYSCFSWNDDGGDQWAGQAILSRHPIIDSGLISFPKPASQESLLYADMVANGDTIRVYTTHLQSVKFKKEDLENIEQIKKRDDSLLQKSRNIFSKLKRGMVVRSGQADIVKEALDKSPHPLIITGDFNDVPNSYTYYTISDGLKDAFLKEGFGIGRTYNSISPTLRIDYILASKKFAVQQFTSHAKNYSDHYMLVADLALMKDSVGRKEAADPSAQQKGIRQRHRASNTDIN